MNDAQRQPAQEHRMNRYPFVWRGFLFLGFFLTALALHHGGLGAPMYYDSAGNLAEREYVFQWGGIRSVLDSFPQRPLPMVSFYLNYLISGMNPVPFRVVNLALLAGTSLLVVVLIDLLLGIQGPSYRASRLQKRCVSTFLGLVFLVHPLQIYVSLYIWQRMALMACFFSFASLAVYLAVRSGRFSNRSAGYALCMGLFMCALLSKENSVTLPAVFLIAEIAFFRETFGLAVKRAAIWLFVSIVLVLITSLLQHPHGKAELGSGILDTIETYYRESGLTLAGVALTQSRVFVQYVSAILIPVPHKVGFMNPQVISRSLLEPLSTLPSVIAVIMSAVAGIFWLRTRPLLGFGILFFLVSLLPEALLVPQYAFLGYRPVLPMFGICAILAEGLMHLLGFRAKTHLTRAVRAGILALAGVGVILAAVSTSMRADTWGNKIRFWQEIVDRIPQGPAAFEGNVAAHALGNLAAALYSAGRYSEAADHYERALGLAPASARTLASLGAAYVELGQLEEAEILLKRAIEIEPTSVTAYKNLAALSSRQQKHGEALTKLRRALELSPYDHSLHAAVGQALLASGDFAGAVDEFRRAVRLNPGSPRARYELGEALLFLGEPEGSIAAFKKAVELKPDYWQAYNALGIAHARVGRLAEALASFQEALKLNPKNDRIRANLESAAGELRRRSKPELPSANQ